MAGRDEGYDGVGPEPEVHVTIHGRVFDGTLRRRSRPVGDDDGRWCVEIRVDDRRLMTWVAADQVEFVGQRPPEST